MNRPARCDRGEQGFAMITVMLVIMIITLLITGSLAYSLGSLTISRHDQDWNAALSSAEAGLDDYLFRLNQNTNYWQYSATNPPPDGNKAFSFTGGGTTGQPVFVQLSGLPNAGRYHYRADVSTLPTNGAIKIYSTGSVGNTSRTVQTVVRQKSFLDFVYYTDYETTDPALYSNPPDNLTATQAAAAGPAGCKAYYAYPAQGTLPANAGRSADCHDIVFVTGDVINGPLATNDGIRILGSPTFAGTVTSAWPGTPVAPLPPANCAQTQIWVDGGSGAPNFSSCPVSSSKLNMPPSSPGLKGLTDPAIGGTQGCLFTGPTKITLNSDGTMNVVSPYTLVSKCAAAVWPTAASINMPLPANGVVYVQNVPIAPTDPNYKASNVACITNPLGYPIKSGDVTPYPCSTGEAFVQGTLKGQLTIATDDTIVLAGNILYQGNLTGTDVLGLIAQNYVQVYHPVDSSGNDLAGANGDLLNPTFDAAIVALNHSFIVPNYNSGDTPPDHTGTINVNGAIAQEYRGPVGTGHLSGGLVVVDNGYYKNYVYDQRLKYLSPPHFIDPVQSAWGIRIWSESNPANYPPPACAALPASCP